MGTEAILLLALAALITFILHTVADDAHGTPDLAPVTILNDEAGARDR